MNENELWERQILYTPNGCQTMSKMPNRYVNGIYPKFIERGHGGNVVDSNGKVYVDYIAALGAVSIGYNNVYVNNAIQDQLEKGISFSLPNQLEGAVAERISRLVPSMEMSKFTKTGSDACSMAIMAARAFTGKTDIIVLGYHGWHPWYTASTDKTAGIPTSDKYMVHKCEYGKLDQLEELLTKGVAAVILEPVVFKHLDKGYLQDVVNLTHAYDALVIFDETVTGGRFAQFTAQTFCKVRPDLTVLGKGLANGMPLAIVGGLRRIMKTFERTDFFASTTFGGECLSLAAFMATADILEKHIPKLLQYGTDILSGFNKAFDGLATCEGYPSRTQFVFPTAAHKALFWQECVRRGVLFGYSNFTMVEHTKADLDKTLEAIEAAAKTLKDVWANPSAKLQGDVPCEVFRLVNR
jgi:glutamate-1-semialdehyde 2,1-aminomutase